VWLGSLAGAGVGALIASVVPSSVPPSVRRLGRTFDALARDRATGSTCGRARGPLGVEVRTVWSRWRAAGRNATRRAADETVTGDRASLAAG